MYPCFAFLIYAFEDVILVICVHLINRNVQISLCVPLTTCMYVFLEQNVCKKKNDNVFESVFVFVKKLPTHPKKHYIQWIKSVFSFLQITGFFSHTS